MPSLAPLSISISTSIATLFHNRPDARNALSIDLLAALSARAIELASHTVRPGDRS